MFQPCGRVCGLNKRYSTYIRSSPFLCFADTASILGRLSYAWLKLKIPFRECVRHVMEERLQGTSFLIEMKNLKNTTWLRWLLFILGPLPQAIRLASFRGIPWTQFLGFSFLSSWLLVEIMVLVSTRMAIQPHASWCHVASGVWDFHLMCLGVFCNIGPGIIAPFTLSQPITATPLIEKVAHMSFWVVMIVEWVFDLCLLSLGAILIFVLSVFIRWFGRRHLGLSQNLLLAFPNGTLEALELDDWAIVWLMLFLINFLVGLDFYSFLYTSTGTVNPGWLAVFG
jgi:hypothetical protein